MANYYYFLLNQTKDHIHFRGGLNNMKFGVVVLIISWPLNCFKIVFKKYIFTIFVYLNRKLVFDKIYSETLK